MNGGGKADAAGLLEANINLQGGAKGVPDSEAKYVLQNLAQGGSGFGSQICPPKSSPRLRKSKALAKF